MPQNHSYQVCVGSRDCEPSALSWASRLRRASIVNEVWTVDRGEYNVRCGGRGGGDSTRDFGEVYGKLRPAADHPWTSPLLPSLLLHISARISTRKHLEDVVRMFLLSALETELLCSPPKAGCFMFYQIPDDRGQLRPSRVICTLLEFFPVLANTWIPRNVSDYVECSLSAIPDILGSTVQNSVAAHQRKDLKIWIPSTLPSTNIYKVPHSRVGGIRYRKLHLLATQLRSEYQRCIERQHDMPFYRPK